MAEQNKLTLHVRRDGRENFGEFGNCLNLLEYINTKTPFNLSAPCAGKGRCGKCRVTITGGTVSPLGEEEKKLLSEKEIARGVRLACMTRPLSDVVIELDEEKAGVGNKSSALTEKMEVLPFLHKDLVTLSAPDLHDQTSDHTRLLGSPETPVKHYPLRVLKQIPEALRNGGYTVTLCREGDTALAVEPGDTRKESYGVAVDIGTTTVASYILDLSTGKNLDVISALNAQEIYGADVISRINHTMTSPEGLKKLQDKITDQIDSMVRTLAARNGINPDRIYTVVIAGNTTMVHLVLGLPPKNIAAAPFISVTTEPLSLPAADLSLSIAPGGTVYVLPSVSGYVGADIVAAVLASGMADSEPLSLLIDIGTNGEIVLGNRDRLVCCSTAAGPAFEGAHVRNGVGGIAGAVNKVRMQEGFISFTTIQNGRPLGICGSGIVDLLSILIHYGIVDETGRMLSRAEAPEKTPKDLLEGMIDFEGEPAFLLVPEEETGLGSPILLTQKDVREIQLAKAAIAAGVDTLAKKIGVNLDDIEVLYLAGGFGSYLHKTSAAGIGLLPRELHDRVQTLGNAAGKGAAMALLSLRAREKCEVIRRKAEYIELSSSPEFQDAYIERMFFSQENTKTHNIF
jgi:uncharacterized 2Fe-2S/4Fe-4S cluster protein (DUF4445 family)